MPVRDNAIPVPSFRSLLRDLATISRNTIQWKEGTDVTYTRITVPTSVQKQALELLGVPLDPAM
jgi:hypothetical protein